jgi:hypothetical protein
MSFFLIFSYKNIKTLKNFNFSGLTHETRDPALWPVQPRTGFNIYGLD